MSPQDLVKDSILALQQMNNTDFVDIQHGGQTYKAKVEYGDFRKIDSLDIGNVFQDEISFLDIDMLEPRRGDSVVYDSSTYKIEYFTKAVGLFKIFCLKEDRFGGLGNRWHIQ